METLKVVLGKEKLLTRLQAHKKRFAKSFNVVLKEYKEQSEKYQKKYAAFAEHVKGKATNGNSQPIPPPIPRDHAKDYEFYINMIAQHTNPTIEVTETQFRELWNDKWNWTRRHYETLMFYARAGGAGSASVSALAADYDSSGEE